MYRGLSIHSTTAESPRTDEIVNSRNKRDITFLAVDRERAVVHYANYETFNPHSAQQSHERDGGYLPPRAAPPSWPTRRIKAEVPDGIPDGVRRTVAENSRTLKFKSSGFEDD